MENREFNINPWNDSKNTVPQDEFPITWESSNNEDTPNKTTAITWENSNNEPQSNTMNPTSIKDLDHYSNRIRTYGGDVALPKSPFPEADVKTRPGWVTHDDTKEFGFDRATPTTKTVFSVKSTSFLLDSHNSEAIDELQQSSLQLEDNTEVYNFSPQGQYLEDIFRNIIKKVSTLGFKIKDCRLLKTSQGESIINYNSSLTSEFNFIYTLSADSQTSNHVANLSSLGGPSFNYPTPIINMLTVFPGWIPYHFSKNNSSKDFIVILGSLEKI